MHPLIQEQQPQLPPQTQQPKLIQSMSLHPVQATTHLVRDRNGTVSGSDPSVTIKVGDTVNFAVSAGGHPFYLKTVQGTGTSDLISGVTNNGATNGTVSWTPTAAGTYYYQCSLHNGMYGTITVN